MNQSFFARNKERLIVVGVLLVLIIIGWVIYYTFFIFHITSITPNPNGASYLSPRLVVRFNKAIDKNSLKVSSADTTISSSVSGSAVTINLPQNLNANATYTITIDSVSSDKGDTIKNHVITLNTVNNSNSLTKEDQQIVLQRQQANKSPVINDPILQYLPHSTLDYSIDSSTSGKTITLTITIQLSAADADTPADANANVAAYEQEAYTYLKSLKGIDLNNYNVVINVINPTK